MPALLALDEQAFRRTRWTADQFLADLPLKWSLSAVCRAGGEIAGFAVASSRVVHVCHLNRVAVLPTYRGRGVGRALVQHVEANARRNGLHTITLELDPAEGDVAAFYAKLDYALADAPFRAAYAQAKGKTLPIERGVMHKRLGVTDPHLTNGN